MVAIFHVYNNKILSKPYDPAGQIRKYWGSVEATNHINDVTSMKDRLDVTNLNNLMKNFIFLNHSAIVDFCMVFDFQYH